MSDVAATAAATQSVQPVSPSAPQPASPGLGRSMWSHGGFSFKDLLDIVNPLQHLPVIGSIYRYLTGDEPAVGTRIIGDALYGGPIGFGVSVASNALLTSSDGKDLGERVLADVFGSRDHDSSTTLGTPQVAGAANQPATPAPMPEWMLTAGTPDGQPRTPVPVGQQNTAMRVASAAPPTKPTSYVPQSSAAAALSARGLASAAAPMSSALPAAAVQPASSQGSTLSQGLAAMPAQPVAMNQLFRSAPPTAPGTPEQAFTAQASQFQRQISQGRGTNGAVLNAHPVPLELSSNLLPVMPAGGHLALGPNVAAEAGQATSPTGTSSQAQAVKPASTAPDQNAIAQKMIDALNKYQLLKKQELQQDSSEKSDQAKLDLSL